MLLIYFAEYTISLGLKSQANKYNPKALTNNNDNDTSSNGAEVDAAPYKDVDFGAKPYNNDELEDDAVAEEGNSDTCD